MLIWIYLVYLLALVYLSLKREKMSDLRMLQKAWFWFALVFILQGLLSMGFVQEILGWRKPVQGGDFRNLEVQVKNLHSVLSIYPVTAIFFGLSLLRLGKAFAGPVESE